MWRSYMRRHDIQMLLPKLPSALSSFREWNCRIEVRIIFLHMSWEFRMSLKSCSYLGGRRYTKPWQISLFFFHKHMSKEIIYLSLSFFPKIRSCLHCARSSINPLVIAFLHFQLSLWHLRFCSTFPIFSGPYRLSLTERCTFFMALA